MTARTARRNEKGAILPMAALLMTVMIGFAGFGVDLGWWYSRAIQLQRAADAASLAAVVWMPDVVKAQAAAQDALKANHIVAGGDITIDYTPIQPQRYKVTVHDAKVESYFTKMFQGDIKLNRNALSEYLLAVPLGSPLNHFGTPGDNIYAAVNGFCTAKEDGDEIQSRFDGTKGGSPANRCPSTAPAPAGPGPDGTYESNIDYEKPTTVAPFDGGYSYYVDIPGTAGKTTAITKINLFDAAYFNNTALSPDLQLASGSTITTTYRLRAPDSTPLDDSDNPMYAGCGAVNPRSFVTNDATFGVTLDGTSRFTLFCTVPSGATSGKYILEAYTATSQGASVGANAYGVWVQKASSLLPCDANLDATCPRVYGTSRVSVYANQASSVADFYLAQVSPQYAGKQMVIKLWDPGEGGSKIQLLDPTGTPIAFSWFTEDGLYSGSATALAGLDVSGTGFTQPGPNRGSSYKFNDRKVILTTVLPSPYPASWTTANYWWKIRYTFSSGTVSDRTTWTVNVLGQPVHLLNE
jgi:hypothetical protein